MRRILFSVVFMLSMFIGSTAFCEDADKPVAGAEVVVNDVTIPAMPAADEVSPAAAATEAPVAAPAAAVPSPDTWDRILAYLNSSAGLTAITGIIAWILARVFTWKPAWKQLYDSHRGMMLPLIKEAEQAIPDSSVNAGARRLDYVLKALLAADTSLSKSAENDLKQAISVAHLDAKAVNAV